jgi:hypothetical protein
MADKKPFLLRIDDKLMQALKSWADDELRSLNGQIEFLLRQQVEQSGRWKKPPAKKSTEPPR